jgi:hypothetical protein
MKLEREIGIQFRVFWFYHNFAVKSIALQVQISFPVKIILSLDMPLASVWQFALIYYTVAEPSKARVCGRSLAGIANSNPAGGHGCL